MAEIIQFGPREPGVEPARPFIDGKPFDETWGLRPDLRAELIARGLVFCTEFRRGDAEYGGVLIAASWDQAETIAAGRGLGERVIGQVGEIIPA